MGSKMDWKLTAEGNVGRDPSLKFTPAGKLFAEVSMAVEVGYGDYKRTEWVNVTVWGEKSAQNFHDFVGKGTRIRIEGDPKLNTWTSKEGESKAQINVSVYDWKVVKNAKPKGEKAPTPYDPTEGEVEVQVDPQE